MLYSINTVAFWLDDFEVNKCKTHTQRIYDRHARSVFVSFPIFFSYYNNSLKQGFQYFKCTRTSLFTVGTFYQNFNIFSWISYNTTLFKIKGYQILVPVYHCTTSYWKACNNSVNFYRPGKKCQNHQLHDGQKLWTIMSGIS